MEVKSRDRCHRPGVESDSTGATQFASMIPANSLTGIPLTWQLTQYTPETANAKNDGNHNPCQVLQLEIMLGCWYVRFIQAKPNR